jgi:serine/threonine protein kinase
MKLKQEGGDLIGQGGYGCVFKPALKCNGVEETDSNKISKLIIKNEALKELKELKKIDKIDKKNKYHIETPEVCNITKEDYINEPGIENCKLLDKINNKTKLVTLQYNYGGYNLKEVLDNKLLRNQEIIYYFFEKLENLFYGLYHMNKNNFIHNDIKEQNIVVHPQTLDIKYIDFGLSREINIKIKKDEIFIYKYGYYVYPFETYLLDEKIYNIYKKGKQDELKTNIFLKMRNDYIKSYAIVINDRFIDDKNKLYINTWTRDKEFYTNIIENTNYEKFKKELLSKLDVFSLGLLLIKCYYFIFNERINYDDIKSRRKPLLQVKLLELIQKMTNSFYKDRISAKESLIYYRENILPLVSKTTPLTKTPLTTTPLTKTPLTTTPLTKTPLTTKALTIKKRCPEDKILNIKTRRCVKKTGKVGKKILKELNEGIIQTKSKTLKKKCPEDKILNKKTKRCVKKTGKVGKKILKEEKLKIINKHSLK